LSTACLPLHTTLHAAVSSAALVLVLHILCASNMADNVNVENPLLMPTPRSELPDESESALLDKKLSLLVSGDAYSEVLSIGKLLSADQTAIRAYRRAFKIKWKATRATDFAKMQVAGSQDAITEEFRSSDTEAAYYQSNNRLGWLKAREKIYTQEAGEETVKKIKLVWAFHFKMPKADAIESEPQSGSSRCLSDLEQADAETQETAAGEDVDEDEDDDEDFDSGDLTADSRRISHECYMMAVKLFQCDMFVTHVVTMGGGEIILLTGLPHEQLKEEAEFMKLGMRMQETKGALPFSREHISAFARNHGGLNEFDAEKNCWNGRGNDGKNWVANLDQPVAPDEERRIFTSAHAQRLLMNRLDRKLHYEPERRLGVGEGMAAHLRKEFRGMLKNKHKVSARKIHHLLVTHGGDRPHNERVFLSLEDVDKHKHAGAVEKLAEDLPEDMQQELQENTAGVQFRLDNSSPGDGIEYSNAVSRFNDYVNKDPHLVLSKDGMTSRYSDTINFDYDDLDELLDSLEAWRDPEHGPGRYESFCGTLLAYFPLHDADELEYLKLEWGNFGCMTRRIMIGYSAESKPHVESHSPKVLEQNTFGSARNTTHEFRMPISWVYQPTEEIRDYFGDDVGLYCEWLTTYTKALGPNCIIGVFVLVTQILSAKEFPGNPDENVLTDFYSVYIGFWSVVFLESWARRETELKFLWGTEQLTLTEPVRHDFIGLVEINEDTGREEIVVKDTLVAAMKKAVSTALSFLCIIFTAASAITAMSLRYLPIDANDPSFWAQQKWEIISAGVNLFVIVVYGVVYEKIADILTDFENHRTHAQYENALVMKNFMFQFFNNYFVLFYIAYFREYADPFSGETHTCKKGSCMFELQIQLAIVFVGKTFGKQVAYGAKPFVVKFLNDFLMKTKRNQIVKKLEHEAEKVLGDHMSQHKDANEARKEKERYSVHPAEAQANAPDYPSTFQDFNDRVIQFGYLVLFAPAFPLAPFLAFINNVIEIRSFGFKICRAYKRPHWKARTGIGAWSGVLNFLGFLAVITNASMIAFVGSHRAEVWKDGQGWANGPGTDDTFYISDDAYPLAEHCRVGFAPNATEAANVDYSSPDGLYHNCPGMDARLKIWQLWLLFVVTEHFVMMLRVLVMNLSPSDPHWLVDEREILQYRLQKVYKHDPDFHKNSSISYQGADARDAKVRMQIAIDALASLTEAERAEAVVKAPPAKEDDNGEGSVPEPDS